MSSGWSFSGMGSYYYRFSEQRTLTSLDVSNRYLILTNTPTNESQTSLEYSGAVTQAYGVDFEVTHDDSGRRLSWQNLGLDGILEPGDIVRIEYLVKI